MDNDLTQKEREQIAEILDRRANEIARFYMDYKNTPEHYGSVELAMDREITRLRQLSNRVCPPKRDED